MRMLLLMAILAFAGLQAGPPDPSGVIEVRVTRPGTEEGIPEVQLTLQGPIATPPPQIAGTTDSDGRFSFRKLAPGRYTLRAQRDTYFLPPPPGSVSVGSPTTFNTTITVIEGKPTPETTFSLLRGGVITGRLRDPNAKAVHSWTITAYQVTYQEGGGVLQSVRTATTDDRGEYRLFWMPPGDYLVAAAPPRGSGVSTEQGSPPNPMDAWMRTFYPGLIDARAVPTVTVLDGAEVSAIDITIRSEATAKVSGRVIGPFTDAKGQQIAPTAAMYLVPRDPEVLTDIFSTPVQNTVVSKTNGQFEIRNVPAGSYYLVANVTDGKSREWGHVRVDVGSRDVEDVILTITRNLEVRARVIVDGQPPRSSIQLQLRSRDPWSTPLDGAANASSKFDPSGVFVFPGVPEGRYVLQVTGVPTGGYVEDIRQGSASIHDEGLVVGRVPSGEVEVVIKTKGAALKGTLTDAEQKPFARALIAVVPLVRRSNTALYKTTTSDAAGSFTVNGLAPGEYKAFAFESVTAGAWMNTDFLAQYESRGKTVTVTLGAPSDVELRLIPKDAGNR